MRSDSVVDNCNNLEYVGNTTIIITILDSDRQSDSRCIIKGTIAFDAITTEMKT
jgi:hypothetical protein